MREDEDTDGVPIMNKETLDRLMEEQFAGINLCKNKVEDCLKTVSEYQHAFHHLHQSTTLETILVRCDRIFTFAFYSSSIKFISLF